MSRAVIGIGSNTPDRTERVAAAIGWLGHVFSGGFHSSAYVTRALNGHDPDYLNAVMSVECDRPMDEVNTMLKDYERGCGRTAESKLNGEVPIDLDIVVWGGRIVRPKDFGYRYFLQGYDELVYRGVIQP